MLSWALEVPIPSSAVSILRYQPCPNLCVLGWKALTLHMPLQPRNTSPCGSGTPELVALGTSQRWLLC